MAIIGISLNEVVRDFIEHFTYTYSKYIGDTDIKEGDVTSLNLIDFFHFEDINELNSFLYLEAPLEIMGHADELTSGIMNQLNTFIMDTIDEEENSIVIVSREINKSIPATNFFLSKTGCRATDIRYPNTNAKEWDGIDVLISANPEALIAKPSGKISVKVNASYNKDVPADYTIDSLLDFIKDHVLREKILNTKITIYEEIKK